MAAKGNADRKAQPKTGESVEAPVPKRNFVIEALKRAAPAHEYD